MKDDRSAQKQTKHGFVPLELKCVGSETGDDACARGRAMVFRRVSKVNRRAFLGSMAAGVSIWHQHVPARAATPKSDTLEPIDMTLEGDPRLARRALVLVPKELVRPRALLVLLHGLGETGNELLGIHAWGERYGLVRAHERLHDPPISRDYPKLDYLEEARTRELNQSLERQPYRGAVFVCPVTPNPHRGNPATILERYASWLVDTLLPAVRQRVGAAASVRVGLDGCSLGGYVGLEVWLRRAEAFQSLGVVQPAIGQAGAVRYAARMAELISRVGPCPIHIETSSEDPYREPSRRLSEELAARGIPNQFRLSPGPHNQPWLREVGTLEMLLWHDRQLNHTAA